MSDPKPAHPKVVLFTRPCPVCQKTIEFVKDFDYIDLDGQCRAYKSEEGTSMCDYAVSEGCFQTYHDHCFDQHQCPAHNPKN